ncbi:hypothetical protein SAMN05421788_110200 [Filimonas lacunae]|uniref:Uncharacterized protein n=2 Tax=Filimonas lacunae TaxID=477680 RepID=A0A1N7R8Q2_9BACT|nr:hypothetical protein SAMN05421788_110200 [Filimonas lacunae]
MLGFGKLVLVVSKTEWPKIKSILKDSLGVTFKGYAFKAPIFMVYTISFTFFLPHFAMKDWLLFVWLQSTFMFVLLFFSYLIKGFKKPGKKRGIVQVVVVHLIVVCVFYLALSFLYWDFVPGRWKGGDSLFWGCKDLFFIMVVVRGVMILNFDYGEYK